MAPPARGASDDPGARHEQALAAAGQRKRQGAYYTPSQVVAVVLDLALEPVLARARRGGTAAVEAVRVLDPACGSGNVLAAAASRLHRALVATGVPSGAAARHVAARSVLGIDIDPEAVRLCRAAVAEALGVAAGDVGGVTQADALADPALDALGAVDVVVGNPPFLSQLGAATARTPAATAALRARLGDAVAAYTDPAAAFLVLAHRMARADGGVVALIEPVSVLTARDASGARAAALEGAALRQLWLLDHRAFDAAVEVCVPVLVRGAAPGPVEVVLGPSARPLATASHPPAGGASWSGLLASAQAVPVVDLAGRGVLGDVAVATADFRDQYYGLAPHVVDRAEAVDAAWPRLVTSGSIDPATLRWGQRPTRFNKATYRHPRIDVAALPPALQRWADERLVPKVLLATQTRVLEAVADPDGVLLPSVPVVSVVPRADPVPPAGGPIDVWHLAAVLTSPAVSAEAARRHLGSGRTGRSMRLRAREVLALPLPRDRAGWDRAAGLLRTGAPLRDVAVAIDQAYGVADEAVLHWWFSAVPPRAAARPS